MDTLLNAKHAWIPPPSSMNWPFQQNNEFVFIPKIPKLWLPINVLIIEAIRFSMRRGVHELIWIDYSLIKLNQFNGQFILIIIHVKRFSCYLFVWLLTKRLAAPMVKPLPVPSVHWLDASTRYTRRHWVQPCVLQTGSRQRRIGNLPANTIPLVDKVPDTNNEQLELDLPLYYPSKGLFMERSVVGGGPLAGCSTTSLRRRLLVGSIEPIPKQFWPNNYGVWDDDFEEMDLYDCLDATWSGAVVYADDGSTKHLQRPYGRVKRNNLKSKVMQKCLSNGVTFHQARVLKVIHEEPKSLLICTHGLTIDATVALDATGFSRRLVQMDKPYNPGYQVAYGILAEVEEHPFDVDKMVFMDWRDSHLNGYVDLKERKDKMPTFLYAMPFSSNRIFLDETSSVARPGLQLEDIQERMVARLKHLGIKVKSIEEDEPCVIPMGGPLPVMPQRVVGIGGTAGMVHPSTGYMVARTLAAAPEVANSMVQYLGSESSLSGNELSAEVWKDVWPIERRRQREFFCFGMDILLKLDLQATRRFFDAFFDPEPRYWHGFLSSGLFLPELLLFGLSLFSHASNTCMFEIMAKGTVPLVNKINHLLHDKD
uniref:lycopene beta-cyclase n=1 Tax=Setaria italica TaxID=4555 RepID=Q7XAV8_SETIT|nr:lycopene cyclase [Setaria italica]